MKELSYLEKNQRGTPDFPIELYLLSENHPRYHMQFHWHNDIEIIHITKGLFHLTLNDRQYELSRGDSVLVPSGIVHGAIAENCVYECLVFPRSMLYVCPESKKTIKTKLINPVQFENDKKVLSLIAAVQNQKNEELKIISLLFDIADEAVKKQDGTKQTSKEKIERIKPAITYIEDNFHKQITIDELAKECLMSNNYFIRFFKEVTLQTPIEFLNKTRIEVACTMLLSGSTVTDTAFACGFNDLSYFIHIFKREMGLSPKQYSLKK